MMTTELVSRLERLCTDVKKAVSFCTSTKVRNDIVRNLTALHTSISKEIQTMQTQFKGKHVQARKNLTVIGNTVEGLLNGLEEQSLSYSEFKKYIGNVNAKFLPSLNSSVADIKDKLEDQPSADLSNAQKDLIASKSGDWKDDLTKVRDILKKAQQAQVANKVQVIDASEEQFAKMREAIKDLPPRINTAFKVVKAPLIPIFSNYNLNNRATFEKLGLSHISVEGYAILLDQTLLAIDSRVAERHDMTPLKFAESVIATINEQSSHNVTLVTEHSNLNPRNKDIVFFWILPTPKVTKLSSMAGRTANSIRWGFPFASTNDF